MDTQKPATRPENPRFSTGPCTKPPTFSLENLRDAPLGRSHRAAVGKSKLKAAIERTRAMLGIPADSPDPLTPNSINYNGQNQNTESYAVFGSADWHFADKWTRTAGIRYTYEEKDFKGGDGTFYERGEPYPDLNFEWYNDIGASFVITMLTAALEALYQ